MYKYYIFVSHETKKGGNIMRVISMFNKKEGVPKTKATLNIEAVLSPLGKKVLLIDTDKQGN